jgi:23S rRNA pseudouridine1911/1915/1917 synthase
MPSTKRREQRPMPDADAETKTDAASAEWETLEVTDEMEGQRLDRALAALRPDLSRTRAQVAIKAGEVTINGKPAKPSQLLEIGQRLAFAPSLGQRALSVAPGAARPQPEAIPLRVVYEDDRLLVVDKPAGLVTHPAPGHATGTLVNALLAHAPGMDEESDNPQRPGIVHRLDKDTSGLMVVAKDAETHSALAAQMKERAMVKRYIALVEGRVDPAQGEIEAPIGRDPRQRMRMAIVSEARGGREARTRFRTLRALPGRTLLEVQLETGRTHQIRVHLAAIHHPVVGDPVYGRPQPPKPPRQFLHAAHLEFRHPWTGEWLVFDAPLPDDLATFLAKLEGTEA